MPKKETSGTSQITYDWNSLKELNRKALNQIWIEAFGKSIPASLYKPIVIPLLAYRLQELRFGGLSPECERYLAALLPKTGKAKQAPPRRLKAGTRLLRTWQGRTHSVTIADPGFIYDGQTYNSLSLIARKITGTQWSGPAFFGLNKTPAKGVAA
jgi:hypothetical protein